ncbi:hypothetical protein BN59_03209 [Legionella massiliensis]|uniref:Alpha/beta hydrolase family protein n=1 Tax=Legionella massiliensis TaxID=1034943 RepID=A0A078L441_9GAMM|nr:hypothetical protein [Legionella massiliensis]CDZ78894.1 hypothetical protein BN59_03209 [Legionella massiliensis]CEE14632.1 hypothetical protein BN1094_03209 [Legionella massiliensis]
MKLLQPISYLLIFLCLSWATYAEQAQQNLGIAFVHGTNDHRQDAESDYWKRKFIDSLTDVLPSPDNYYVVHCDFRGYMWEEATGGCLAEQLLKFIDDKKITKLTIYTHSDGGNVMRWILSNPTYDERYMRLTKTIHQVIAIAPSSGGTVLADDAVDGNTFEAGLGWLLGYSNGAVKQQRIGDMAIYNDQLLFGTAGRPSLPVPFRVVVGSDVTATPFSSVSYCNGYFLTLGLKITQSYLDSCSDGFLNCTSQAAAGSVWFYDWQKTDDGIPLNHSQSRHSCFGFDQILRNDLINQRETL